MECGEDHIVGSRPDDCFACLSDRCDELLAALRLTHPEFCSARCPSVFTSSDQPRHCQECESIRTLIGAAPRAEAAASSRRDEKQEEDLSRIASTRDVSAPDATAGKD